MSAEFVRAAEKARATMERMYDSTSKGDKAQAEAVLALAFAMSDIASAIDNLGSATRYAGR
jgi:hypothetical protein